MKKSISFIFVVFIITNSFAQASNYDKILSDLVKLPEMKNASLAIYAENLSTGALVFSHNPQVSLAPASVFKILPTSMAIEMFGPDYKFKTELAYSGSISSDGTLNGDLYIIGYGDPCLGSDNFAYHYNSGGDLLQKWMNEVKKLGIKKVNGDIISDISYFGEIPIPDTWIWEIGRAHV